MCNGGPCIDRNKLPRYDAVPNLDDMTHEDITHFALVYQRPSRKDAQRLIGDRRKGFTTLCGSLSGYAWNKATAMTCRMKGDIQAALVYEQICESIYNRLPEDLRW